MGGARVEKFLENAVIVLYSFLFKIQMALP